MLIASRQHPIVDAFRELAATPDLHGRRLLLDGVHLIRDASRAGVEFELAVVSANVGTDGEGAELLHSLEHSGAEILRATDEVMAAISPVHAPSPMVAIARRPLFPSDVLDARDGAFLLVAIDVQDPGNVGALMRAGEAAGVTAVVVCGSSANPFGWKAVRGSMGSVLRLPIAAGRQIDDVAATLKTSGARLIGAVPRDGADPDGVDWTGRVALVLGGEGNGLDAKTIAMCDDLVTIPMTPPVESLNVAAAGAVLCYAARRQRR